MNSFIKKFIGFSLGPLVGAFIALITIPLTTYFIDPSEYGKASMFTLFQMVFGTFIYLGIDQSYTREYHSEKNKLNLFQNAILVPLILSLFLLIVILIIPEQISLILFESKSYLLPSILFGIMVVFMVIERFILLSIRMAEKAFEYSMLNILVKVAILLFTLIYVLFIRRDFLAVIYSAVIGQIIGDLYLLVRYRKLFFIKDFKININLMKKMIIFGLPIVVATSLSSLLNSFDRISLRTWSTFFELGIFAATLKIAGTLNIVQSSFTSFWVPTAYRWYDEGKKIEYFKIVSDGILLLMSILFFIILFSKELIVTILSPGYEDAKFIIGFLCLQPIMYTISETTSLGIVLSRKSYLSIWVGIISLIPNIFLNFILVPILGALGAAIATSVSYFCFFIARTYFSNKNGMKFSVKKHYIIFILLMIGAYINSFESNYSILFNFILFLLIILFQTTTFKRIIQLYKYKNISGNNISKF